MWICLWGDCCGLYFTCNPMGPGAPGNPLDPSSPLAPKGPCWPLGPSSPSAPCTTEEEKTETKTWEVRISWLKTLSASSHDSDWSSVMIHEVFVAVRLCLGLVAPILSLAFFVKKEQVKPSGTYSRTRLTDRTHWPGWTRRTLPTNKYKHQQWIKQQDSSDIINRGDSFQTDASLSLTCSPFAPLPPFWPCSPTSPCTTNKHHVIANNVQPAGASALITAGWRHNSITTFHNFRLSYSYWPCLRPLRVLQAIQQGQADPRDPALHHDLLGQ